MSQLRRKVTPTEQVFLLTFSPSVLKSGFSKNSLKLSMSRSQPMLGRSGIMWAITLKPAFLARWKQSPTAATVCPLLVSLATSSKMLCRPISSLVHPYDSICSIARSDSMLTWLLNSQSADDQVRQVAGAVTLVCRCVLGYVCAPHTLNVRTLAVCVSVTRLYVTTARQTHASILKAHTVHLNMQDLECSWLHTCVRCGVRQ